MTGHTLASMFPGPRTMARIMRGWERAATPLGPAGDRPEELKIPLRMLPTSRFGMSLGWGPDLHFTRCGERRSALR